LKKTASLLILPERSSAEGNINAVSAVTASSTFSRFAPSQTLPSGNSGCYRPIKIFVPEGTVLNAKSPAAVSAANVETSQRIVDLLLRALPRSSRSCDCRLPGTMNTLTVGGMDHGTENPMLLRNHCRRSRARPNADGWMASTPI